MAKSGTLYSEEELDKSEKGRGEKKRIGADSRKRSDSEAKKSLHGATCTNIDIRIGRNGRLQVIERCVIF